MSMSDTDLLAYRISELERVVTKLDAKVDVVGGKVDSMALDIAGYKGRASAWGTISGALMGLLVSIASKMYMSK
jgi:hypothetical protein